MKGSPIFLERCMRDYRNLENLRLVDLSNTRVSTEDRVVEFLKEQGVQVVL